MSLRVLRKRARLSQVELAAKAKMRQTSISALELGKVSDPRMSTIKALSAALGQPVAVVMRAIARDVAEARHAG